MAAKGKYRGMLERIFAVREGLAVQAGAPGQERRKAGAFRLEAEMPVEPLTERELEILRFLNSHMPTPEIAEALAVSVNTVRTHIKSIYSKLGAHSRSEAIGLAKRLKILG